MLTCELCRFFDDTYTRCHAYREPIHRNYKDPICRHFQPWEKACHCCRFAVEDGTEYYCLHGYHAWAVPWDSADFKEQRVLIIDNSGGCCYWDGRQS